MDLTEYAEAIACIGITVPRGVAAPREVTGSLVLDLGEGGRAMWVDGGGDVDPGDLSWAIAAALESRTDEVIAAMEDLNWRRHLRYLTCIEQVIRDSLLQAGYSTRRVSAFLGRRRQALGGLSIRAVLEGTEGPDIERVVVAVVLVGRLLAEVPDTQARFAERIHECEAASLRYAWCPDEVAGSHEASR